MTEAEQLHLTRWGIPGWTAILSTFLFVVVDIALSPQNATAPLFSSITSLVESATAMSAALAALFAAAAGVPLGFCIYQGYFWLRWNSPVSRDGFLPPLVVGRIEDLDRTTRDLSNQDIARGASWRAAWVNHPMFRMDHGWRWRYLENLFTEAVQRIDTKYQGMSVYSRHRTLLDLMHTLGASLAGIYLGYVVYLLAKVKLQSVPFTGDLVLTAVPLFILLVLLDCEDQAKKSLERIPPSAARDNDRPANTILRASVLGHRLNVSLRVSHPSAIFLFFVGAFLYLVSPSPYPGAPANPTPLRTFVLFIPVLAWFLAKLPAPRDIRLTETALMALSLLAAYLLATSRLSLSSYDWAFGWSILAFLTANLAFLKNRQNVRDDLISLEYFTLRRALDLEHPNEQTSEVAKRDTAT